MRMLKSKEFWLGAVVGVAAWHFLGPKVRSKMS